jgi:CheY-like chemotaxis protein
MTHELRPTVLLVEDDRDFRSVLSDVLSDVAGCRVVEADDGDRALEILKALTPDLILTDLAMPHMDGWSLLDALQGDPQLAAIPYVVLTGLAERIEWTPCPMTLTKPVRIGDLLALLDMIDLSRPRCIVRSSGLHRLDLALPGSGKLTG